MCHFDWRKKWPSTISIRWNRRKITALVTPKLNILSTHNFDILKFISSFRTEWNANIENSNISLEFSATKMKQKRNREKEKRANDMNSLFKHADYGQILCTALNSKKTLSKKIFALPPKVHRFIGRIVKCTFFFISSLSYTHCVVYRFCGSSTVL